MAHCGDSVGPGNSALNQPPMPGTRYNGIYKNWSVTEGLKCMYVIIPHRSSGPLLHSGAPQDKRTEVGVSE